MIKQRTSSHARLTDRAAGIRLILLGVLIAWLIPVPRIIAGSGQSPSFALTGGYLALGAIWTALTAASFWWLNDTRFHQLREYVGRHLWRTSINVMLFVGGLTALRLILLLNLMYIPDSFRGFADLLPTIVAAALVALLVVVVDDNMVTAAIRSTRSDVPRLASALTRMWPGVLRFSVPLTFALILGLLLASLSVGNLWDHPLSLDPSVHIYLGQELVRGGIPYQSVVYFHPPLRFAISALWTLAARAVHQPVPATAHVIDMLVTAGLIVLIYLAGKEAANSRTGGVLAVIILVATEHLNELIIAGPTFRLTTGLLMLLGLWAGQRGRWFWAGLAGAMAAMTYLPAGAVLPALATAAIFQDADRSARWRSVAKMVAGAAVVVGLLLVGLAAYGVVVDAYQESIRAVLLMLTQRTSSAGPPPGITERLQWLRLVLGWRFRGDAEFALVLFVGPLLLLVREGPRAAGRSPRLHIPFVTAVWLLLPLIKSFDASVRDSFLILLPLAPLGGAALNGLLDIPHRRRFVKPLLAGGVTGWGLIVGMADLVEHNRSLYQPITMSYADQREAAANLNQALLPGEDVLSIGNLWYQVAANSPNALPVVQMGARGRWANTAAGWTDSAILAALRQRRPVVVFLVNGTDAGFPLAAWLADDYVYLGQIDPAGDLFWQSVYVRADRLELREILDRLPLE